MLATPDSVVTPNSFVHFPLTTGYNDTAPTIVYFVTGNPGLIGYYHEFLSLLSQPAIDSQDGKPASTSSLGRGSYVVAGFSLGGFDLTEPTSKGRSTKASNPSSSSEHEETSMQTDRHLIDMIYPPGLERKQVYGLRDQIELCYARLVALVARVRDEYNSTPPNSHTTTTGQIENQIKGRDVKVILMGHSVGAYIALELVRKHHSQHLTSPLSILSAFTIVKSILLTPTILNISHSPSGRIVTPILSYLPFFPSLVQLANNGLTSIVPKSSVEWLVHKVTGMPVESAGLKATTEFLRSGGAVRQALSLARDEMREIGPMEWGEEIWRTVNDVAEEDAWKAPKLYFWFARSDHWVADVTREEIVRVIGKRYGDENTEHTGRSRRQQQMRPEVMIDESGRLVHAWCIEQSELVAERVKLWLEEEIEGDR